ncbi:FtsX-like permease family protein [Streptacidiphilus sp. N1-3]|uniref:FtsX-like permease family protein n=1 Tax=Streptacidiphilus alkalitolerans TaxID=3342712 RepID=A0ABV6WTY9_9ACTN
MRGTTPPALAPWTLTRLRSARGAALGLALLVLVSAFLAAALPLALDRAGDRALRQILAGTDPAGHGVEARAEFGDKGLPVADPSTVSPALLAAARGELLPLLRRSLPVDPAESSYGLHSNGLKDTLTDPGLPVIDGPAPVLTLDWQPDQAQHTAMVSGRLPADPRGQGPLEIAVSADTARTLGLHLGQLLHLRPDQAGPVQLSVVGIYRPLGPGDTYWTGEPGLLRPGLDTTPSPYSLQYWHAEALVSAGAFPLLNSLRSGMEAYWWFPVADGALTAHAVPAIQTRLAGLLTGPGAAEAQNLPMISGGVALSSSLPVLLTRFTDQDDALTPVLTVGAAGTVGVGAAVLLMAAGLAADRRSRELALLRARGGSMGALARRLLAETLVCTTTGAVLGTALALALLPNGRHGTALLAALAVWGLTTLAVPLRSLAAHRGVTAAGRPEELVSQRPSRRRTVVDLTVLVAAVAAATAVRRQGFAPGGGVDPLLSGAPLLLGAAGALLLIRLYPWPLRLAARPVARRRGAVGFLGLVRAGRGSAVASALPLLAVLLALTVAVFGTEVLSGIGTGRDRAVAAQVGADAQIVSERSPLPPALVAAVRRSPGVRSVLGVQHSADEPLTVHGNRDVFDLYGVDPAGYARLSGADRIGRFDPALLRYSGSGPLPVLASPALAAAIGPEPMAMDDQFGTYRIKVVGVLDSTPLVSSGEFMLVSGAALAALPPSSVHNALDPATLLLQGPVDGKALRAAVARTAGDVSADVLVRSELRAQLDHSPLQAALVPLYAATVLAAALLSLMAVLLSLLQAAPARSSLLAGLRTMGLTPGQGYRLILVESLPQILAAVVVGTLLGLAAIPLFGPSVNLAALVGDTGTAPAAGLRAEALPLLGPGRALLLLAVAVVLLEAAVIGRRQISTVLRAGDQR